jgi:hypothetical protein
MQTGATMKYRRPVAALAVIATALVSQTVRADIQYSFTALSSSDFNGESFSVVVPDFVTANTTIPVASLTSCAAFSTLGPASCLDQSFFPHYGTGPFYDTITSGVSSATTPNIGICYYFDEGDFGKLGTFATNSLLPNQTGVLTVSAVPEASTWALMTAGLGCMAFLVRRRTPVLARRA